MYLISLQPKRTLSCCNFVKQGKTSPDTESEVSEQQSAEADVLTLHIKEECDEVAKQLVVEQKDPLQII